MRACLRPAPASPHLPSIFLERGEKKTIGRSPQADVVIDEPSLSRVHAAVKMSADGDLSVEDLGSTNGVFMGGMKIRKHQLKNGDVILVGDAQFRYETDPTSGE